MSEDGALPFASVVVPVRNGAGTLAGCLESLVHGTYPSVSREIVVVDNGSTDDTARIADRYRVRTVYEPRRGRPHARNRGILESCGEIVAFTDADCLASPRWLSRLVEGFADDGVWAVAGEIHAHEPTTVTERFMARREEKWQQVVLSLPERFAITSNVAFRRQAFERIGTFDPEFVTAEDVDFGWRFFADDRMSLRYAPEAVVHHRLRRTLRELIVQQVGLGYGRAILRTRYGLPRGYALGSLAELGDAIGALGRIALRRRGGDELAFALHEVALRASLRIGSAGWRVSPRRLRAGRR